MNKRIKKKKFAECDFRSTKKDTKEIYSDLQICKDCKKHDDYIGAIAESIEG
jgi:hypothetical protein